MEEIIQAVQKQFGEDITDFYLVKRNKQGVITHITPAMIVKQEGKSIQTMINNLLSVSEALKTMAADMLNRTLHKN